MKFYLKALLVLFLAISTTILVERFWKPSERPKEIKHYSTKKSTFTDDEFARKAFIICEDFVLSKLKSPASAEFPYDDYQYIRMSSNEIVLYSYVDAGNSFGAIIRNNFRIHLKFNGGEWEDKANWSVLNLSFE